MNTEFSKQCAVCEHYRKKTDFWRYMLWGIIVIQMIGWFVSHTMSLMGVIIGLVALIPASVRLYQYGREVDKLGEMVGK